MVNQDQIKELEKRIEELSSYLKIDEKIAQIKEDELKSQDPEFWDDPKKAEALLKVIKGNKFWVESYEQMKTNLEDIQVLIEFHAEGEAEESEIDSLYENTITELENLELKNMLSSEEDQLNAVLQITAGAGGTESCDWASMLMRMYIMWGEKNGYKVKEINYQAGDVAGVKTVTLEFNGDSGFGYLKGENGVHRLVRISPFDSNAKRHTSFASVYVYPLVDDSIEIHVNPSDLEECTTIAGICIMH